MYIYVYIYIVYVLASENKKKWEYLCIGEGVQGFHLIYECMTSVCLNKFTDLYITNN